MENKNTVKKVGRNKSGQFTKGNTFSVGNKNANKYKSEYASELLKYFSEPPTRVDYIKRYDRSGNITEEEPVVIGADYPTFEGFAASIGVTRNTLDNWRNKHAAFARAYERAEDLQKNMLIVNGLGGRYNGNFAKFIAANQHGMVEKSEHKIGGTEDFTVNIQVERAEDGRDQS